MSKMDIYSQYISRQQHLSENSLVSGQKLISEREVLINRLMAEGFTSKQIDNLLNNYFQLDENPITDTWNSVVNYFTPPSVKAARAARAAATTNQNKPVSAMSVADEAQAADAAKKREEIKRANAIAASSAEEAKIPSNPPGASSSGPPVSARSGQSVPETKSKTPTTSSATSRTGSKSSSLDSKRATAGLGRGPVADAQGRLTAKGTEYVARKGAAEAKIARKEGKLPWAQKIPGFENY